MELRTAYEVLGVNGGESRAQVWEACVESRRPERSLAVPPRRREEMERALSVVERHFAAVTPRALYPDECESCGWGPARPLATTQVTGGLVLFTVEHRVEHLCRRCGVAAVNDAQTHCLALGWWSALAPFATVVALHRNRRRRQAHEAALAPAPVWRRAGALASRRPDPQDTPPPWRRPSSWALPALLLLWSGYLILARLPW